MTDPKHYDNLYEHLNTFHERIAPEDDHECYEFIAALKKQVLFQYLKLTLPEFQPDILAACSISR